MKYFISEFKYLLNELVNVNTKSDYCTEIRKKGFLVLENFISCSEAEELISRIDSNIGKYSSQVWRDGANSDARLYDIGNVEPRFNKVFSTNQLNSLYAKYISSSTKNNFVMANRVIAVDGNLGSGGGWHRDTMGRRQLKYILYLTDVDVSNGAFEYVPGSHRPKDKWRINKFLGKPLSNPRYTNEDIETVMKELGYQSKKVIGKAGTLLIADTSGLHRGSPLLQGERVALTQYLADGPFASQIKKLFVHS